jgi:hypothetical protein
MACWQRDAEQIHHVIFSRMRLRFRSQGVKRVSNARAICRKCQAVRDHERRTIFVPGPVRSDWVLISARHPDAQDGLTCDAPAFGFGRYDDVFHVPVGLRAVLVDQAVKMHETGNAIGGRGDECDRIVRVGAYRP